eukprot:211914_1
MTVHEGANGGDILQVGNKHKRLPYFFFDTRKGKTALSIRLKHSANKAYGIFGIPEYQCEINKTYKIIMKCEDKTVSVYINNELFFTKDEIEYYTEEDAPIYICRDNPANVTIKDLEIEDHGKYEGDLNDKRQRHGKGKCTYNDGNIYEGEWKHDEYHGKGKHIWGNGDIYEGDWDNGDMHGKGTKTEADGDIYVGDFEHDKYHGKGKLTYDNGTIYDGYFEHDEYHGKGKLTLTNGHTQDGDWKNGDFQKGKETFDNGRIYEGEYKNSERHGMGKWINDEGNVEYEGEFKNGVEHGKGKKTYYYPTEDDDHTGDIYIGDFAVLQDNVGVQYNEGVRSGKGKLIRANKDVYEGDWDDDKRHGKGKWTFANGDIYEGDIDYNGKTLVAGKGKWIYANKDIYDGDIYDGIKHGNGIYKLANGDVYHNGEWKDDVKFDENENDFIAYLEKGVIDDKFNYESNDSSDDDDDEDDESDDESDDENDEEREKKLEEKKKKN